MEILRRSLASEEAELSDDALVLAAEELFLELDAREAANAHTQSR